MTAAELYAAMCAFAHEHGWERVSPDEGGWWWNVETDSGEMTLGEVLDEELQRANVDVRKPPAVTIHVDEPGTLEAGSG